MIRQKGPIGCEGTIGHEETIWHERTIECEWTIRCEGMIGYLYVNPLIHRLLMIAKNIDFQVPKEAEIVVE